MHTPLVWLTMHSAHADTLAAVTLQALWRGRRAAKGYCQFARAREQRQLGPYVRWERRLGTRADDAKAPSRARVARWRKVEGRP